MINSQWLVNCPYNWLHGNEAIHEDKAEEQETERRKANVIVHGLPESGAENFEQWIDDDLAVLATMFHEIEADDVKVVNTVRLGKKSANPVDKCLR